MSGNWILDTAVLAVSLFNTMLLLWLGVVVLSSADRRSWGIWLTAGGLLSGGIFFLVHSAIIGRGLRDATADLDWMWHLGWVSVIASPLAWYVVMLWYAGFFAPSIRHSAPIQQNRALQRIHLPGLGFTFACAVLLLVLLVVLGALPKFDQVLTLNQIERTTTPFTPILVGIYALYNIACLSLSIHALQHPEPSSRWMGDLARRRAQPWLTSASIVLLVVSLLVSAVIVFLYLSFTSTLMDSEWDLRQLLAGLDLTIEALIAVAVILMGKATVSYEIFTGKTLPRRGFFRQWRRAVILAAGYSVLIAATVTLPLPSIYALLAAMVLLVLFYALLSVRLFGERERAVRDLRPFLLAPTNPTQSDSLRAPFDSLCENVLNARIAYLCPVVPLASPLAYPAHLATPTQATAILAAQFNSPNVLSVAIAPDKFQGAAWAIPLWSERGLTGILLLGERNDGGLYTQEEIEIAQATGERVLDAQASAELTRRLIDLQRGRLAATQVVDRRARRVLHDDILPQLHTALLGLSSVHGSEESLQQLTVVHRALSDLLREMPAGASPQLERQGLLNALRSSVGEEFASAFDAVTWTIDAEAEARACALSALNAEVLYAAAREAIRNAAKHGRGGQNINPLHLSICAQWCDGLTLEIQDDGVGFVSALNGSGQGLALHTTMMAVIGGALTIERLQSQTRVRLFLPEKAL